MKTLLLSVSIVGMFSASANASDVIWQTPVTISGASDVITSGTFFGSWAPGDDAYNPDALPVNGVTFNAYGSLPKINASASNLDHYNGFNQPGTADGNYNTILQSAIFNWNSDPIIVSWNGMTAGNTYLVEAWVNDGRGNGRTETVSGGANTSAALTIAPSPGGPGQYVIGTFVADGTGSETISFAPGAGGYGPMLNLLQVRDITPVPEPSTLALLATGVGAMLYGFRRKCCVG